jgi:hypothetical protein
MKTKMRFRQLVRKEKWAVVTIDRANLYKLNQNDDDFGNLKHYSDMVEWCNNKIKNNEWACQLHNSNGAKRFAFKHAKHATMFTLKWT